MKKALSLLTLFVLALTVGVVTHKALAADTMMMNVKWQKAMVWWAPVAGARKYNIYYTEKDSMEKWHKWNHAVRNVPLDDKGMRSYTIGYLKPGVTYVAKVSAVGWNGKEFWWSEVMTLKNMPMN